MIVRSLTTLGLSLPDFFPLGLNTFAVVNGLLLGEPNVTFQGCLAVISSIEAHSLSTYRELRAFKKRGRRLQLPSPTSRSSSELPLSDA